MDVFIKRFVQKGYGLHISEKELHKLFEQFDGCLRQKLEYRDEVSSGNPEGRNLYGGGDCIAELHFYHEPGDCLEVTIAGHENKVRDIEKSLKLFLSSWQLFRGLGGCGLGDSCKEEEMTIRDYQGPLQKLLQY